MNNSTTIFTAVGLVTRLLLDAAVIDVECTKENLTPQDAASSFALPEKLIPMINIKPKTKTFTQECKQWGGAILRWEHPGMQVPIEMAFNEISLAGVHKVCCINIPFALRCSIKYATGVAYVGIWAHCEQRSENCLSQSQDASDPMLRWEDR